MVTEKMKRNSQQLLLHLFHSISRTLLSKIQDAIPWHLSDFLCHISPTEASSCIAQLFEQTCCGSGLLPQVLLPHALLKIQWYKAQYHQGPELPYVKRHNVMAAAHMQIAEVAIIWAVQPDNFTIMLLFLFIAIFMVVGTACAMLLAVVLHNKCKKSGLTDDGWYLHSDISIIHHLMCRQIELILIQTLLKRKWHSKL